MAISALLGDSTAVKVAVAIGALIAYPVGSVIYNLYLHPLAKFPGPRLWAASRIPWVYNFATGSLVKKEQQLHDQYGYVVRLAPDTISFAEATAWDDVYAFRPGHKLATRDKDFYGATKDQADNIITTTNIKFHARVRKVLSNSFTEDSLRTQHPLIEGHADVLVQKLRELAKDSPNPAQGATVNITDWINFFTMDVIGDLAFGEPFGCLERGEYHDWVRNLFQYFKVMSLAVIPRLYPTLGFFLEKLMPQSVIDGQKRHIKYASECINRRLDSNSSRPDFMTPFMKNNINFENMSRDEILSTFNFVIAAGSETTATVLTGIFSHLVKNARVMKLLCDEIRTRFGPSSHIKIDALHDLPYLVAAINEGLRICNPVPGGLPRVVPKGGDTYAGIFVPEGTKIGVRTLTINRSERYFTDANEFVPERWLEGDSQPNKYREDQLSASKPFSVGIHSCLGHPLAWVELRLVLAKLLCAFDFEAVPGEQVDFDEFPVIMIIQKGPVNLRIKPRF